MSKHHHHTDNAMAFHHSHEEGQVNIITHLELGMACDDQYCASNFSPKLVRPGYNVRTRVAKRPKR